MYFLSINSTDQNKSLCITQFTCFLFGWRIIMSCDCTCTRDHEISKEIHSYACELQTYFIRNTVLIAISFKVSSVCIIILTFITVTRYCGCLIYTTKSNNTFQLYICIRWQCRLPRTHRSMFRLT